MDEKEIGLHNKLIAVLFEQTRREEEEEEEEGEWIQPGEGNVTSSIYIKADLLVPNGKRDKLFHVFVSLEGRRHKGLPADPKNLHRNDFAEPVFEWKKKEKRKKEEKSLHMRRIERM